jgi:hypothetical protein
MGTLTADQSVFVDTMSRMILRESSDFEKTTSDEELDEKKERKDFLPSTKRLIRSSKMTDQRFMNIFKVRQARLNNIKE